jgi:oligoribonuclease NrnB/cAMP/cGMP phosphodiesterase (DHH superfamily)
MKPLVIYHAHCTDGFGAAFAAWMKFGDEAEYLPASYGKFEWPNVVGRDVYILDFSFSREETEGLVANAKRMVWLDHHKTAFEMWCGKALDRYEPTPGTRHHHHENYVLLDNNKSGALLAWEYFHPDTEVPMMIKHIDDRDRWQFKIEGSKEFHAALASYKPWSFEQWDGLTFYYDLQGKVVNECNAFYSEGSAILRAHEQNVKSAVGAGKRECTIRVDHPDHYQEFDGLTANCPPHLASDAGHELAVQSGTFGLCWYMGRDGKAKVSLRSNGEYDVSAIAKSFGGGGHRNAAGFEVDMSTLMGWMK